MFINFVYDLVLALQVDRAAHQNKGCVEGVLIRPLLACDQVHIGPFDNFLLDTLVLALMVDRHVAENTQTQLSDLLMALFKHINCIFVIQHLSELLYCVSAEQGFDANIAKGEIDECFQ